VDQPSRPGYKPGVLRSLPLAPGLGLPSRRPAAARLLLLGLLAAALLAAPLAFPRVQPQQVGAGPLTAPDEASALAAARAAGRPVEALSDRTEFSQTFANPSGTLTLNEGVVPVRVHRPNGAWAPVDLTLQAQPDGSVAPVASFAGVAFSGGGTSPLARIVRNGEQLVLGWPGVLPAPALSGSTATYANVLPGVDLQLTAQSLGFSDLLIVKSADAARNPALLTVRLALATSGVTLRPTAAGGLSAVDGVDQQVFGAPAASMWDATGASRAPVGVRVGPGELDLLPDQAMLTSLTTRFPVSIDPYVSVTGVQQAWTKVDACFPDQTYWNGANDSDPQHFGEVKIGRSPSGYGDPCDGLTYRSYFQFDTAKVADKVIHSATFNAFETYAPACNAEPFELWWTGGINSSTDWNAQAGWIQQLASVSTAHGYPPGTCSARTWVSLSNSTITGLIAKIAAGDTAALTLGLRTPNDTASCHADSSGNNCQWKKFDSGSISSSDRPFLSIEYNTPPNTPGGLFTNGSPFFYSNGQIPCNANANYVNTTTPTLHASISDPDDTGSSQPQPLSAVYRWSAAGASGTVASGARTPGSGNTSLATSVTFPAGHVANGQTLQWSVVANDGIADGPATGTCNLTIDTTAQTTQPAITSTDGLYPAGGANPPTPVGTPGAFTFGPAGDADVAGYLYGLNTSTPWKLVRAAADGTAAVTIVPPVVGDNSLVVRIIGLGGNLGPVLTYDVITGHGTTGFVQLGHWGMDEGSGTTAADSTGGHDATASGSFGWTTGHTGASGDHALDFTSTPGGFANTQEPVVDTRFGYTVSAWVKLDDTNALYHALTQDGVNSEAFALESFSGTAPRWAFSVPTSDTANPTILHALSDAAPKAGVWTHLVGVFCADPSCLAPGDTAPGRLYLYVDDGGGLTLQSTQPAFSSPWQSFGGLEVGRGKFNGAQANYLNGAVDDVTVYWGDPCPQPAAPPAVSTCSIA
jgi:Concanavalin A-like lectin/glucanases superfamily